MGVNQTLSFANRKPGDPDECSVCGRKRLGKQAVKANFHPDDPPEYSAVYCDTCLRGMVKASDYVYGG